MEWLAQIRWEHDEPDMWLGRVRDGFGLAFHPENAERFPDPETAVRVAEGWAPSLVGKVTAIEYVEGAVT